ncbi:DDE-type integrase/transposase/recombinase [Brevibacillus brevis]|uniref:DDE-type integrase/transposase/recombinase n=1 Tax=Brevibacillus brevis TaxID=1393 RepID=UPI0025A59919|nr:DDE-type integrase/transposase/recombinase [Brevibacillus brevis]WJQ81935.1 DDE-type integrase/transposase/recombinase [Brevibacillus brevis]
MRIEIFPNSILEVWPEGKITEDDSEEPALLRVLWLNSKVIVTIDIKDERAQPFIHERELIENEIIEGNTLCTSYVIPRLLLQDYKYKDKDKAIRDQAWSYIEPLVTGNNVPDIFHKNLRGILIDEIHQKSGVSKTLIRRNLRKYWQRGMIINALLPDYVNCGGKGKSRDGLGCKLGRPNQEGKLDPDLVGINVTEDIKKKFRNAISNWYNKRDKRTLYEVYELMLGKFFKAGIDDDLGIILEPQHLRPTYRQFYYWYRKEREVNEELTKRLGQRKVNLKHRPIEGTFDHLSFGPGSIYQIDATIGNIYLVNRKNREWVIGRPVIYFVVDVFSRLIAGLYVGLEGPSWIGAMLAFENAGSDKVEYCRKFGIEISPEEWPARGLPEKLTTDRGEYVGNKPTHLIQTLNVKLEHLPPCRPDWKPFVEKQFDLSDELYLKWTPGAILERMKERGERDTKQDAVLDIHEFETILIECVLYHNKHYLTNYRRTDAMIEDDVKPIPYELWNWGRKKSMGSLSYVSTDQLRINLLPSRKSRFTASGIKFNKELYTCITAEEESWRLRARNGEKITVEYSFDPRDTSRLFLRHEDGSFEECFNLVEQNEKHVSIRKVVRWEEQLDILAYEARQAKYGKSENTELRLNLIEAIKNLTKEATLKTSAQTSGRKYLRTEEMKEHRMMSKLEEREERKYVLEGRDDTKNRVATNIVDFPIRNHEKDQYVPPVDQTELLRRALEEDGLD